jgi:hypothetical protein
MKPRLLSRGMINRVAARAARCSGRQPHILLSPHTHAPPHAVAPHCQPKLLASCKPTNPSSHPHQSYEERKTRYAGEHSASDTNPVVAIVIDSTSLRPGAARPEQHVYVFNRTQLQQTVLAAHKHNCKCFALVTVSKAILMHIGLGHFVQGRKKIYPYPYRVPGWDDSAVLRAESTTLKRTSLRCV